MSLNNMSIIDFIKFLDFLKKKIDLKTKILDCIAHEVLQLKL